MTKTTVQTCVSLIAVPSELLSPNLENKTNLDLRSAVSESKKMRMEILLSLSLWRLGENITERKRLF